MANVSVNSISTVGGITTLKGHTLANAVVTVRSGGVQVGQSNADNYGQWQISFPSAGNGTVTVNGGGRSVQVGVSVANLSATVSYPAYEDQLQVGVG